MTNQLIRPSWAVTALTASLLLGGCATTPSQQPDAPAATSTPQVSQQVLSWPQRYAQLSAIDNWNLLGSVSITQQNKTNMASLTWAQPSSSRYTLTLYGPLSLGRVSIAGDPNQVTLQQSGHTPVSASSPEALMQQQLGWSMPVSDLYYWVRGLAAPGATADFQFDKFHRIVGMEQNGWTIQYQSFMQVNNIDLPQRIVLTSPNLQLTLAVRQWMIQPQQVAMGNNVGK